MVWFLASQIISTLISLVQIGRMTETDKDLGIMVLRYQLGIAERKLHKPVRANRAERMTLAVLAVKLKKQTKRPASQFRQLIRLVQPETVFSWHRAQQFAISSAQQSDWAVTYFNNALARGLRKNHAYRCLTNRWLGIIWKMWQTGQPYDEAYHLKQIHQHRSLH